jgi:hypothetical protein
MISGEFRACADPRDGIIEFKRRECMINQRDKSADHPQIYV